MEYKPYQWQFADVENLSPLPSPHFLAPATHKTMAPQNSQIKTAQPSVFNAFMQYLPLVQWVLTIVIAISVFALSQRDSQTVQAQNVVETRNRVQSLETYIDRRKSDDDKRFDELKSSVLSKEVFDAYHKNDVERMERIEKMVQQLLENNSR